MKKYFLPLLLLISSDSFSQTWNWINSSTINGQDYIRNIKIDNSNHILLSGSYQDTVVVGTDTINPHGKPLVGFISRRDINGNPIWTKAIVTCSVNTFPPGFPFYISIDNFNNIFLSSHFSGNPIFGNDTLKTVELFVAKYDSNGNALWARSFGDKNPTGTNEVQLGKNFCDSQGNIYLGGSFFDTAFFSTDTLFANNGKFFIVKFDKNGNEKWVRQCGGQGLSNHIYDLSGDGTDIYFTGRISDSSYFGSTLLLTPYHRMNTFISKMDSSGNFLWTVGAGGQVPFLLGGQIVPETVGEAIKVDASNHVFILGCYMDTVKFGNQFFYPDCGGYYCQNFFVAAYDKQSNFLWLKNATQPSASSYGEDLEIDDEENLYVGGRFKGQIGFDSLSVTSITSNKLF